MVTSPTGRSMSFTSIPATEAGSIRIQVGTLYSLTIRLRPTKLFPAAVGLGAPLYLSHRRYFFCQPHSSEEDSSHESDLCRAMHGFRYFAPITGRTNPASDLRAAAGDDVGATNAVRRRQIWLANESIGAERHRTAEVRAQDSNGWNTTTRRERWRCQEAEG